MHSQNLGDLTFGFRVVGDEKASLVNGQVAEGRSVWGWCNLGLMCKPPIQQSTARIRISLAIRGVTASGAECHHRQRHGRNLAQQRNKKACIELG